MFDKDGKLDERSRRILSEQTIPPRFGSSPGALELSEAGLTADEINALTADLVCFGTSMVYEENGVKRRIAPEEWHLTTDEDCKP